MGRISYAFIYLLKSLVIADFRQSLSMYECKKVRAKILTCSWHAIAFLQFEYFVFVYLFFVLSRRFMIYGVNLKFQFLHTFVSRLLRPIERSGHRLIFFGIFCRLCHCLHPFAACSSILVGTGACNRFELTLTELWAHRWVPSALVEVSRQWWPIRSEWSRRPEAALRRACDSPNLIFFPIRHALSFADFNMGNSLRLISVFELHRILSRTWIDSD